MIERSPGDALTVSPKQKRIVFLFLTFFGLIYLAIPVVNHYYFRTFAYDYGVYNQAFYDFAHFRTNHNTVMEPPLSSFMQIHVAFLMYVISPTYWLLGWLTGTYTLLVVEAAVVIAGGYAVYLFLKEQIGDYRLALLGMIHYFLLWGHFNALGADYTDTTVGAALMPFFLLYLFRKNVIKSAIFFLLILLTKENMPLWLVFVCLSVIILKRKDHFFRKAGSAFLLAAGLYFIFIYPALVHAFEDKSAPYSGFAYSILGNNMGEAVSSIFLHPLKAIELLYTNPGNDPACDWMKAEFYFVFLVSGGLLLFRKPVLLVMFIPIIAQKMYNEAAVRWGILSFYSIEVVSILTICAFISIACFKNKKLQLILASVLLASTLWITVLKLDHSILSFYTEKQNIFSGEFYKTSYNIAEIKKGLALIPDDEPVCASDKLVPHLAFRSSIHCFPNVREAKYIALLKTFSSYPLEIVDFNKTMEKYKTDPAWEIIYETNDLVVLRKRKNGQSGVTMN